MALRLFVNALPLWVCILGKGVLNLICSRTSLQHHHFFLKNTWRRTLHSLPKNYGVAFVDLYADPCPEFVIDMVILYVILCYCTPLQWNFTLSVSLCVCLWTELCPLCIFHNASWIYFMCTHHINQLQKMCHMSSCWKNPEFGFWGFFF